MFRYLSLLLLFTQSLLYAQHHECSSHHIEHHDRSEARSSVARKNADLSTTYTVPLVIHIVHRNGIPVGDTENISDAEIQKGVRELNEAYNNEGQYQTADGVDANIEFCLASTDPNGNSTNGIVRVANNEFADYDESFERLGLKNEASPAWDPLSYCNVWLVYDICNGSNCAIGGEGSFPENHGTNNDGIVMVYFQLNRALFAHEMGHYLGLFHTFQGGCSNNDCTRDGDRICDTPPQDSPTGGCNTVNSCNTDEDDSSENNPFRSVALGGLGDRADIMRNFMDYTDCRSSFTPQQSARMRSVVVNERVSLLSSLGCVNNNLVLFKSNATTTSESGNQLINNCRLFKDIELDIQILEAPSDRVDLDFIVTGSASNNLDYEILNGDPFSFDANNTNDKKLTLRIWDDNTVESNETIEIEFLVSSEDNNVSSHPVLNKHTVTIEDNDFSPLEGTEAELYSENFDNGIPQNWVTENSSGCNNNCSKWFGGSTTNFNNGVYISPNRNERHELDRLAKTSSTKSPSIDISTTTGTVDVNFDYSFTRILLDNNDKFTFTLIEDGTPRAPITIFSDPEALTVNEFSQSFVSEASTIQLEFTWETNGNNTEYTDPPAFDNIKVIGLISSPIEENLKTKEIYLGPFATAYIKSAENTLIAKIENLSDWDYGCTTFQIDRTGTLAQIYNNANDPANFVSDKTLLISPTNGNPNGIYNITLYYTEEEIQGWEATTENNRSQMNLFKTENAISTNNGSQTFGKNRTVVPYGSQGLAITGRIETGFGGFGVGLDEFILSVENNLFSNEHTISIAPNPFNNSLNVSITSPKSTNVELSLYNISTGQEVKTVERSLSLGKNDIALNFNKLTGGIYLIEIKDFNGNVYREKIINIE